MNDDDFIEDDHEECYICGGIGYLENECTCGDDTCCCLNPTPPMCPECNNESSQLDS